MDSRHVQPNVQNDFGNSLLLLAKGVRALPPLPHVVLAPSEGVPRSATDRKAGGRRQRQAAASSTPSLPPQPQPVQPAPQAGKRRRIAPKLVSADESGAGHIATAPPHPGSLTGVGAATGENSRADSRTDAAGGSSAACVLVEDSLAFAEGGRGGLSSASQARSRVAGAGEDGACVAQYLFQLLSREIMASDGTKVMGVGAGGVPMLQKYLGVLSALDLAVAAAPAKDDALDAAFAAPVGLVGKALSDGLFELLGLFPTLGVCFIALPAPARPLDINRSKNCLHDSMSCYTCRTSSAILRARALSCACAPFRVDPRAPYATRTVATGTGRARKSCEADPASGFRARFCATSPFPPQRHLPPPRSGPFST